MINEIFTSPTTSVCLAFSATNNCKLHLDSPTSGTATFSDSHHPYSCMRRSKIIKLLSRSSTQYTHFQISKLNTSGLPGSEPRQQQQLWMSWETIYRSFCEPVSPIFNDPDCTLALTLDLKLETSWKSNQNCHRCFKMSCKNIWVNTHLVNT